MSVFSPIGSKFTVAAWSPFGNQIVTGHESGKIGLFDAYKGKDGNHEINSNDKAHFENVTDLQMSADGSYFITSSKDKSARIFDTKTLDVIKTFATETPLNSAVIAPGKPYVCSQINDDA